MGIENSGEHSVSNEFASPYTSFGTEPGKSNPSIVRWWREYREYTEPKDYVTDNPSELRYRSTITFIAEPHATVDAKGLGKRLITSAKFERAYAVAVGDYNKLAVHSTYVVQKVSIASTDVWQSLNSTAKKALNKLVLEPDSHSACSEFQAALKAVAQPNYTHKEIDERASVSMPVETLDCNIVVVGDHNRTNVDNRHVAAKGSLPLGSLLKEDDELVHALAHYLREPTDLAARHHFEARVSEAVMPAYLEQLLDTAEFDPGTSVIRSRYGKVTGTDVAAVMVGDDHTVTERTSYVASKIVSDDVHDLVHRTAHFRAEAEVEAESVVLHGFLGEDAEVGIVHADDYPEWKPETIKHTFDESEDLDFHTDRGIEGSSR